MTISSPASLDTVQFADGQVPGSITPAFMRVFVDSSAGVAGTVQTTSYTAVLTDRGTVVEMNSASALNFTVPPNSSVAFDVGTVLEVCQIGAGQVTMVAGAGVTLSTPTGTLTARAQYSTLSARQRVANVWIISGDLS
jgi:hypothetical protein